MTVRWSDVSFRPERKLVSSGIAADSPVYRSARCVSEGEVFPGARDVTSVVEAGNEASWRSPQGKPRGGSRERCRATVKVADLDEIIHHLLRSKGAPGA